MGEGARAAIWAEQNGMDFADMDGEQWMRFLDEDAQEEADMPARRSHRTCPICCKRLANRVGVLAHIKALHAEKASTRPDWQKRIEAWKASNGGNP
jgi:hypothetical protein